MREAKYLPTLFTDKKVTSPFGLVTCCTGGLEGISNDVTSSTHSYCRLARLDWSAVACIRLVRRVSQHARESIDDVRDSVYPLIGLKSDFISLIILRNREPRSVCQGMPQFLTEFER